MHGTENTGPTNVPFCGRKNDDNNEQNFPKAWTSTAKAVSNYISPLSLATFKFDSPPLEGKKLNLHHRGPRHQVQRENPQPMSTGEAHRSARDNRMCDKFQMKIHNWITVCNSMRLFPLDLTLLKPPPTWQCSPSTRLSWWTSEIEFVEGKRAKGNHVDKKMRNCGAEAIERISRNVHKSSEWTETSCQRSRADVFRPARLVES